MFFSSMRMTSQKKILTKEMDKLKSFFTASLLHKRVAQANKRIGLATVYRFLKEAEKKGDTHSFVCDSKKIYSTDKKSHAHFTCEKCGVVKHITVNTVDFLKEIIADEVCHFQIELAGICSSCRK